MAILFTCKTCGKPYQVDERFAGKKAACRACGTINAIPAESEADDIPLAPAAAPMTSLQTLPVRVPHFDDTFVPLAAIPENSAADQAAANAAAEEGLELADVPPAPPAAKPPQQIKKAIPLEACPNCGIGLATGTALCTSCGFNLKTGQKISTAVVAQGVIPDELPDDEEPSDRRPPTPALRLTSLILILIGVFVSALPLIGVRGLATTGPLLGASLSMIGAVLYFIDGAWEWGLAGVGAMMVSVVILLAFGNNSNTRAPTVANNAPTPAPIPRPPPATTQSADPDAKIIEVAPGKYSIHAPGPKDDPVKYWQPVLQDKNPKIRAIVIQRLATLPEKYREKSIPVIADAITDTDPEIRLAVLKDLAQTKTPKTVAAAIIALDDTDPAVAQQALKLLAQYKDDAAIDALAKHYATFGTPVLDALGGYDSSSKEKILAAYQSLLTGSDLQTRTKIIELLALSDPPAATKLLMQSLADGDPTIRHLAMARLAEMQYAPAIDAIAQHLSDDAESASTTLIKFGQAAEKAVAAKLADPDLHLRQAALNILKQIGTADSLEAIQAVAKDTDFNLAISAREIWRKIDPGAFPPAEEALYDLDGRKEFVTRALATLKTLAPEDHQKKIAKKLFDLMMSDAEAPIRTAAYEALQTWADAATKDAILAALKGDLDEGKRGYAIKLAVFFKDRRAVKPLCDCLAAGKNLSEVIAALHNFDTAPEEYLMPILLKGDATVQANCFDLLKDIGTRRCFMALNALTKDKNTDEATKKRAKETLIAINRRLNTAEAEAARKKTSSVQP